MAHKEASHRVLGHLLRFPNCHGHRTLLTAVTDPFAIRRMLAHFGLPSEVTPLEPPRLPPEPDLPWELSLGPTQRDRKDPVGRSEEDPWGETA